MVSQVFAWYIKLLNLQYFNSMSIPWQFEQQANEVVANLHWVKNVKVTMSAQPAKPVFTGQLPPGLQTISNIIAVSSCKVGFLIPFVALHFPGYDYFSSWHLAAKCFWSCFEKVDYDIRMACSFTCCLATKIRKYYSLISSIMTAVCQNCSGRRGKIDCSCKSCIYFGWNGS